MSSNNINYGEGGAASCVLVPPFNCVGKNYDDNYISKIANISDSGIKTTIERELKLSKIFKKLSKGINRKFIEEHFILINDYCILDKSKKNLKKLKERGCNIDYNDEYVVLYSKNGACKPIKKGNIVSIEQPEDLKHLEVVPYIYLKKELGFFVLEDIDGNLIEVEKINRFCGHLGNINILYMTFSNPKLRRKNILDLLKSVHFMIKNNIVHCDLKLQNIVCNEKSDLKIIDFGGAFSLGDSKYFNFSNSCKILKSESDEKINFRTQYNRNFANNILDFISIHTEYYTPPEILTLKLILMDKDYNEILQHILESYNLVDTNVINSLKQIILYISQNKKKMLYELQCKKNINSFIYKFDTFSMGIILRETFKILNKYFGIVIEESLLDLIEKMTDLNFETRLNIKEILNHKYFSK